MNIIKSTDHYKKFSKEITDFIRTNPSLKLSAYRNKMSELLIGSNHQTLISLIKSQCNQYNQLNDYIDIRTDKILSENKVLFIFEDNDVKFCNPKKDDAFSTIKHFLESKTTNLSLFLSEIFEFFKNYILLHNNEKSDIFFKLDEYSISTYFEELNLDKHDRNYHFLNDCEYGFLSYFNDNEEFIDNILDNITLDYNQLTYSNSKTKQFIEKKSFDISYPRQIAHAVIHNYIENNIDAFLNITALYFIDPDSFDLNEQLAHLIYSEFS